MVTGRSSTVERMVRSFVHRCLVPRAGFEPAFSGLKDRRPTTRPTGHGRKERDSNPRRPLRPRRLSRAVPQPAGSLPSPECGWRDSNPHVERHRFLRPARLPITPHPLVMRPPTRNRTWAPSIRNRSVSSTTRGERPAGPWPSLGQPAASGFAQGPLRHSPPVGSAAFGEGRRAKC